jgi:hypothetical protein
VLSGRENEDELAGWFGEWLNPVAVELAVLTEVLTALIAVHWLLEFLPDEFVQVDVAYRRKLLSSVE